MFNYKNHNYYYQKFTNVANVAMKIAKTIYFISIDVFPLSCCYCDKEVS